jgi:hypothetical protein
MQTYKGYFIEGLGLKNQTDLFFPQTNLDMPNQSYRVQPKERG